MAPQRPRKNRHRRRLPWTFGKIVDNDAFGQSKLSNHRAAGSSRPDRQAPAATLCRAPSTSAAALFSHGWFHPSRLLAFAYAASCLLLLNVKTAFFGRSTIGSELPASSIPRQARCCDLQTSQRAPTSSAASSLTPRIRHHPSARRRCTCSAAEADHEAIPLRRRSAMRAPCAALPQSAAALFVSARRALARADSRRLGNERGELVEQLREPCGMSENTCAGGGALPLVRIAASVAYSRRSLHAGCLLDLYRALPFVQRQLHWLRRGARTTAGPISAFARSGCCATSTRRSNRIIRAQTAERWGRRPYDIVLLSDHGQSITVPFRAAPARTADAGRFCRRERRCRPAGAAGRRSSRQASGPRAHPSRRGGQRLRCSGACRQGCKNGAGARIWRWFAAQLPRRSRRPRRWTTEEGIVVAPTGGLAHVYFSQSPTPLTLSEVRQIKPRLVTALVEHPSIAVVAGRAPDGGTEILSRDGSLSLDADGHEHRSGEHPLDAFLEGVRCWPTWCGSCTWRCSGATIVLFSAKIRRPGDQFPKRDGLSPAACASRSRLAFVDGAARRRFRFCRRANTGAAAV